MIRKKADLLEKLEAGAYLYYDRIGGRYYLREEINSPSTHVHGQIIPSVYKRLECRDHEVPRSLQYGRRWYKLKS